jgi:hypothetical protein
MAHSDKHPAKTPATGSADKGDRRNGDSRRDQTPRDGVQGEGNYDAARAFDEAERRFVESGKVDAAARAAAPKSEAERREMEAAEQEGRRRAKGEDPALTKARPGSAASSSTGNANRSCK